MRQGHGLPLLADGDIPHQGVAAGDLLLPLRLAGQSGHATAGILGGGLGRRLAIRPQGRTLQVTLALGEEDPFQAPLLITDPDHGLALVGGLGPHLGVTLDNLAHGGLAIGAPLDHLRGKLRVRQGQGRRQEGSESDRQGTAGDRPGLIHGENPLVGIVLGGGEAPRHLGIT